MHETMNSDMPAASSSSAYLGPSLVLGPQLDQLELGEVVEYAQAHVKEARRLVKEGTTGLLTLTPSTDERDKVVERWLQLIDTNFPPDHGSSGSTGSTRVYRPGLGAFVCENQSFKALDRLFDALVVTCRSLLAAKLNQAELVAWCGALVRRTRAAPHWDKDRKDQVVLNQELALGRFVKDQEFMNFVSSVPGVASVPDAKARLVELCGSCLRWAHRWQEELGTTRPEERLDQAHKTLCGAEETLWQAIGTLFGATFANNNASEQKTEVELLERARTLVHRALAIQRLAANDGCNWRRPNRPMLAGPGDFKELCRKFGGDQLLKERITEEWVRLIGTLREYEEEKSRGGEVKKESTQALVDGMFRVLEEAQSTSLQQAAQELVELRHGTITETSVRDATGKFLQAVENVLSVEEDWTHEDVGAMNRMLTPALAKANEILLAEYSIRLHQGCDPALPETLLLEDGKAKLTPEDYKRIPERLCGAEHAGQYRLDLHIAAGGYGDGWRAHLLDDSHDAATAAKTGRKVFVKTFRPAQEDRKSMLKELAIAQRIRNIDLLKDRRIVQVEDVLRNVSITTSTQRQGNIHCLVTEYVEGGELYNYTTRPFTEGQARFLVRQIFQLVHRLHNHKTHAAYYHADIKLENIVVDGSDLKLIDYGSLKPVPRVPNDPKVSVKHSTWQYSSNNHDEGQSVDLYAVGVILLCLVDQWQMPANAWVKWATNYETIASRS